MFFLFGYTFKKSNLIGIISVILLLITNYFLVDIIQTVATQFGLSDYLRLNDVEKGSGRLIAWDFAWQEINRNTFFFGNGFDYTNYYFGLNLEKLSLLGHQGNAHNSYLTFWLETGLIGLIFFMFGFVKSFLNMSLVTNFAWPAMFAISFSMFFESWFTAGMNPFLIQIVLILTLSQLPRLKQAEEELKERKENLQFENNQFNQFAYLKK
jgi:O-antigen ligase